MCQDLVIRKNRSALSWTSFLIYCKQSLSLISRQLNITPSHQRNLPSEAFCDLPQQIFQLCVLLSTSATLSFCLISFSPAFSCLCLCLCLLPTHLPSSPHTGNPIHSSRSNSNTDFCECCQGIHKWLNTGNQMALQWNVIKKSEEVWEGGSESSGQDIRASQCFRYSQGDQGKLPGRGGAWTRVEG